MKEFNLSEKIWFMRTLDKQVGGYAYFEKDIKEFIKKLKEDIQCGSLCYDDHQIIDVDWLEEKIDKLAGEKLI